MGNKKILVVTAKWPYVSKSTDGGDSTLFEIINSLGGKCDLDLLCFRDDIKETCIPFVNKIIIYREDFAGFNNYSLHNEEKFLSRIKKSEIAADILKSIHKSYDIIIFQHVMFVLGLVNDEEILDKGILFPMFTGTSYEKAGEAVPKEYFDLEKMALPMMKRIISPSMSEKGMLISKYGVPSNKIEVISRPVRFKYQNKNLIQEKKIRLVYVASIRMQKDHMSAMRLISKLLEKGYTAHLKCIGAIQDTKIYDDCTNFINENKLSDNIEFVGNKSSEEVYELLLDSDFNISVSHWETFGRGIYEGMVVGLPTIVLKDLECVVEAVNIGVFPLIVRNIEEMANTIIDIYSNRELYALESEKGKKLGEILTEDYISKLLVKSVLR